MKNQLILAFSSALVLQSAATAASVWFDVATGATAAGTTSNYPAGEAPSKIIDGNFYDSKYLNFDKLNTGVVISGANSSIPVTRMILVAANDAPERDPASYTLEGSNDGSGWTSISSGTVSLPETRNTSLTVSGVSNQSVTFANTTAYAFYRVTFPTVRDAAGANSMQIAEISLLGMADPGADILDQQTYTVASVGAGTFPDAEGPSNAVDNNPDTKYLNFGKESNGLSLVTAGQFSVVTALTLSQADDAPARDVTSFTLRGSVDGVTFQDIVTDQALSVAMGLFESTTVTIPNTTAYRDYQFVVTGLRSSADTNSFQFGELQLHGMLVPEPGTIAFGMAGLALLARRRRVQR